MCTAFTSFSALVGSSAGAGWALITGASFPRTATLAIAARGAFGARSFGTAIPARPVPLSAGLSFAACPAGSLRFVGLRSSFWSSRRGFGFGRLGRRRRRSSQGGLLQGLRKRLALAAWLRRGRRRRACRRMHGSRRGGRFALLRFACGVALFRFRFVHTYTLPLTATARNSIISISRGTQASAASLAHSSATRPAGRNFTVTALRPIRSAISTVCALSYSPRCRDGDWRVSREAERIRRMRR